MSKINIRSVQRKAIRSKIKKLILIKRAKKAMITAIVKILILTSPLKFKKRSKTTLNKLTQCKNMKVNKKVLVLKLLPNRK